MQKSGYLQDKCMSKAHLLRDAVLKVSALVVRVRTCA